MEQIGKDTVWKKWRGASNHHHHHMHKGQRNHPSKEYNPKRMYWISCFLLRKKMKECLIIWRSVITMSFRGEMSFTGPNSSSPWCAIDTERPNWSKFNPDATVQPPDISSSTMCPTIFCLARLEWKGKEKLFERFLPERSVSLYLREGHLSQTIQ